MSEQVQKILDAMDLSRDTALYCDYDGTLTPIVENPDDARLTDQQRDFITEVAGNDHITLLLISGRPISTLKDLSRLNNITWVGSHGYEIEHPDGKKDTTIDRSVWENMKDNLSERFDELLDKFDGSAMEMKTGSFAFHYRQVKSEEKSAAQEEALALVDALSSKYDLNTIHGKEVIEIKPAGFDKGVALLKIREMLNTTDDNELYLGDDTTDKDAMDALPEKAINVWVGNELPEEANYLVDSVDDIYELLKKIHKKYS